MLKLQINIQSHGEPKISGTPAPQSYVTPLPPETSTTATTTMTTTTTTSTATTTTPFGYFQGPTPVSGNVRVKIVKTPKKKKARKVSEEDFYNHQPTTRFEHFTKGPSLKFMDPTHSPSHFPASTTTASSTTTTAASTTSAATVSPTTSSATSTSTTVAATTTTSITRRSGMILFFTSNHFDHSIFFNSL